MENPSSFPYDSDRVARKSNSMIRCSFCGSRKHASAACPVLSGKGRPGKGQSYEEGMAKLAQWASPASVDT
jgi:hypothetical protein